MAAAKHAVIEYWPNDVKNSTQNFYYTIVAPNSFRANTNFTFNLTIHDSKCELNKPIVVRISIEDQNDDRVKFGQDVVMQSNVTEIVSIPIGAVSPKHTFKLVAKGISGITIDRNEPIALQLKTRIIFI